MRLSFRDRIHVSVLSAMAASGLVMVAVWQWPKLAKLLAMNVVGLAVLGAFFKWVRAADDFKGSRR